MSVLKNIKCLGILSTPLILSTSLIISCSGTPRPAALYYLDNDTSKLIQTSEDPVTKVRNYTLDLSNEPLTVITKASFYGQSSVLWRWMRNVGNNTGPFTSVPNVVNRLTKVILPKVLERIEESAFEDLVSLVEVDFSTAIHLTYIGEEAFSGTSLRSVDLSANKELLIIDQEAFEDCLIEELKLPTSLKFIGESAFANNRLTNVSSIINTLHPNVLGKDVFENNR